LFLSTFLSISTLWFRILGIFGLHFKSTISLCMKSPSEMFRTPVVSFVVDDFS
jgi:hypothetical protein